MKRRFALYVLFLLSASKNFGQSSADESFNQAFVHIYVHTASEDVNQALIAADSLYHTAKNDLQKIRSLMLISDMYHRMANRDSSIHYTLRAERIAVRTDNYLWQARIYGVLSTQHRETGLLTAGRRYVQKGLEVIEKIDNPQAVNQFKGQSFQELGYYDVEEGDFSAAMANFKRAEPFLVGLTDSVVRFIALAQNDERIGFCHLELGAVDSAAFYYRRALASDEAASQANTPIKGFIYNGLGRVHLDGKQFDLADSCFRQALTIAEATDFPNLKISVYETLAKYYELTGDDASRRQYTEKYLAAMQESTARHKRYADRLLTRAQHQLVALAASRNTLVVTVSALLIAAGLALGIYVRKQRANGKRYRAMIRELRSVRPDTPTNGNGQAVASPSLDREKDPMPESTKQELLSKLERFESSQQFTDRNISIAVLAGKMKTNTKYLSYIINNYRNKDFNSYVNELRINYIIGKMDNDSRYLNYKISYLAEECGFATHSQFATVFKHITGLSPSTFIQYRKKEVKRNDLAVTH